MPHDIMHRLLLPTKNDVSSGYAESEAADLTEALQALKPHDHLCLVYGSQNEWLTAIVPFITVGLERGEKCLYITASSAPDRIRRYLSESGINVSAVEEAGQLSILRGNETCTRDATFSPDKMISVLIQETEQALTAGYSALRVSGEMSRLFRNHRGSERLVEYETKLNRDFFPKYPCLAICLYDFRKVDAEIVKGAVLTHPRLMWGNSCYRNFYYILPERLLAEKRAEREVKNWLDNLEQERRTREALINSEERFRTLAKNVPGVIYLCKNDEQRTMLYLNEAVEEITGYRRDDFLKKRTSFVDLYHPEHKAGVFSALREALENNRRFRLSYRIKHRNGKWRWIEEIGAGIYREGKPELVEGFFSDVTDYRESREGEERFRLLVENSQDVVWTTDSEGHLTYISKSIESITGFTADETMAMPMTQYCMREDHEALIAWFQGELVKPLSERARARTFEMRYRNKDGCVKSVEVKATYFMDEHGNFIGIQGSTRDMTERKRSEEVLKESEERYRSLYASMMEGVALNEIIFDKAGRPIDYTILDVNPQYEMIMGLSHDDAVDSRASETYGSGYQLYLDIYAKVAQTGENTYFETYFAPIDKYFGISVFSPSKGRFATVFTNITDRKRAEEALKDSEEKLRTLVESSHDGICLLTLEGEFAFANQRAVKMTGAQSASQLRGISFCELIPENEKQRFRGMLGGIQTSSCLQSTETEMKRLDGSTFFAEINSKLVSDAKGNPSHVMCTVRDITERKHAEKTLIESEKRYRRLFEDSPVALFEEDFSEVKQEMSSLRAAGVTDLNAYFDEHPDLVSDWIDKTQMLKANREATKLFRAKNVEGLAALARGKIPGPAAEAFRHEFVELFDGRTEAEHIGQARDIHGETLEVVTRMEVIAGHEEQLGRVLISIQDVTEQVRAREEVEHSYERVRKVFDGTVASLAGLLELRDPYTADHQRRVAQLACAVAEKLDLERERIKGLRVAALLHDIGKLNVPAEILSKPGRLSEIEMSMVQQHPGMVYDILADTELPWPVAEIVHQHHERLDGSGYPRGLRGQEILLESRILGVADVVEAMASHRPYRPALPLREALDEINKYRGVKFDATVVDACVSLFEQKGFEFEEPEISRGQMGSH